MVRAWRMMVMHVRDSARGTIAPRLFARRVVRSMPAGDMATRHRHGVRSDRVRSDGVRSAMAAEGAAALTTSSTMSPTSASAPTTATGVATAATAGGC
jgi:hypothetical protein